MIMNPPATTRRPVAPDNPRPVSCRTLGTALVLAAGLLAATVQAQPTLPGTTSPTPPPAPPLPASPVATFRHLLALPPAERSAALASRPAHQRDLLATRLADYENLPPHIREDRLRATDLYWHLQQLVRRAPSERGDLLRAAPDELRPVLAVRLAYWDQLPSADRADLLEHEGTLRYMARTRSSRQPPLPPATPTVPAQPGTPPPTPPTPEPVAVTAGPAVPLRVQAELARLNQRAGADLHRLQQQWQRFFEGASPRRDRALEEMSASERQEMQAVLERFRRLTPEQRRTSVTSFSRLASMSPAERSEFLRNAERWTALPQEEREAWRQIVNKLPVFPPLPTQLPEPPLPQPPLPSRRVANHPPVP